MVKTMPLFGLTPALLFVALYSCENLAAVVDESWLLHHWIAQGFVQGRMPPSQKLWSFSTWLNPSRGVGWPFRLGVVFSAFFGRQR
jgi:hypothetical protein